MTYPDDRAKIKNAFLAKTTGKQTNNAAALAVARLVRDDNNPLDLRRGPYKVSADSVKGIAGVKKEAKVGGANLLRFTFLLRQNPQFIRVGGHFWGEAKLGGRGDSL